MFGVEEMDEVQALIQEVETVRWSDDREMLEGIALISIRIDSTSAHCGRVHSDQGDMR